MRQRSARINRNAGLIALLAIEPVFWLTGRDWALKPISTTRQRSTRINGNAALIAV
ncbi:hypothetical protein IV82_GL001727 [Pediococcus acidilactici]|nr:hypothetical protein IV82_GL001727 [Pediococcus acidilactici]